jgi:hypothetical protein
LTAETVIDALEDAEHYAAFEMIVTRDRLSLAAGLSHPVYATVSQRSKS